jgi:hypothetical protein
VADSTSEIAIKFSIRGRELETPERAMNTMTIECYESNVCRIRIRIRGKATVATWLISESSSASQRPGSVHCRAYGRIILHLRNRSSFFISCRDLDVDEGKGA